MDDSKQLDKISPYYYEELGISPLEYIIVNNIDWREANVIKYISRYKNKNGLEDLHKARWYLEHLIKEIEDEFN